MQAWYVAARMRRARHYERLVALLLLASVQLGCVGKIGQPSAADDDNSGQQLTVGRLSFALSLAADFELDQVTYTLTLANTLLRSGKLSLAAGGRSISALFLLPPDTGYRLALQATEQNGARCMGSAQFDIVAGQTTPVLVTLSCPAHAAVGSAEVMGRVNQCPSLVSISADHDTAALGETIQLHGLGTDHDDGPSPLAYVWTTNVNTIAVPGMASTELRCTQVGFASATLWVSDGDPGCQPAHASIGITCTEAIADEDAGR